MSTTNAARLWLSLFLLLFLSMIAVPGQSEASPEAGGVIQAEAPRPVRLGIDNIDHYPDVFRGKRVGLITNSTGMDSMYRSTVDVLAEKVNLVALFAPEHGIRGAVKAGDSVGNAIDKKSGLPVYSLYGADKKPTPAMLENIDVLVFDIQDVGARAYTYIYTMAYAMQACKEQGKTMVVLDRPNPLGGLEVEGGLVKPGFESFIGMYPIPVRHGMTVGELAQLFNEEYGIGCNLVVITMTGWQRSMYFSDTGLPWVMTSPNIPTPDTALLYPGTGLFGGTNVSEGVGTTRPFEFVGAPWLNAEYLAWRLNRLQLPGVVFRPAQFVPRFGLYQGENCGGVQLHVTDRRAFRPVNTALNMLSIIRELGGDNFAFKRRGGSEQSVDLIAGDDALRTGRLTDRELMVLWQQEAAQFKEKSAKYYLY